MQPDEIESSWEQRVGENPARLYPLVRDRIMALRDSGVDETLSEVMEDVRGLSSPGNEATAARLLLAAVREVNAWRHRLEELERVLVAAGPAYAGALAEIDQARAFIRDERAHFERHYGVVELWEDD